jgi:hypothetical protein
LGASVLVWWLWAVTIEGVVGRRLQPVPMLAAAAAPVGGLHLFLGVGRRRGIGKEAAAFRNGDSGHGWHVCEGAGCGGGEGGGGRMSATCVMRRGDGMGTHTHDG